MPLNNPALKQVAGFVYSNEIHVDPVNGSDANTGSSALPFKTLTAVGAALFDGATVILHSGTITNNLTITNANVTVVGATDGAASVISGQLTINNSAGNTVINRLSAAVQIVIGSTAKVTLEEVTGVSFTAPAGTTATINVNDCDFSAGNSSVNSVSTLNITNTKLGNVTLDGGSIASFNTCPLITGLTVNTATAAAYSSTFKSASNTGNVIANSAGSVTLSDVDVFYSNGTLGAISMASNYKLSATRFNFSTSTLTGTQAADASYTGVFGLSKPGIHNNTNAYKLASVDSATGIIETFKPTPHSVPVMSRLLTAPPTNANVFESYIVPASATGAWAGLTDKIVTFTGEGWLQAAPSTGDSVAVLTGPEAGKVLTYNGGWTVSTQVNTTILAMADITAPTTTLPPAIIDVYSFYVLSQNSASNSITLSNPSDITKGRVLYFYLSATATTSIVIQNYKLDIGGILAFHWNGAAWVYRATGTTMTAQTASANVTLAKWNTYVFCNTGLTVTLPVATSFDIGSNVIIKAIAQPVTVVAGGADTFESIAYISPGESVTYTCNAVGYSRISSFTNFSNLFDPRNKTAPIAIGNFTSNGSFGSAATTVDINSSCVVTQTTAGAVLTLSNPTLATSAKVFIVQNNTTSTASFILNGVTILPGAVKTFYWNTNSWATDLSNDMVGATSSVAGKRGFVPTPAAGQQLAKLTGAGTWDNTDTLTSTTVAVTANGVIGSAVTTVDIVSKINVNPNAANYVLTIVSPTVTTVSKRIVVNNISTANNCTVNGVLLTANSIPLMFLWDADAVTPAWKYLGDPATPTSFTEVLSSLDTQTRTLSFTPAAATDIILTVNNRNYWNSDTTPAFSVSGTTLTWSGTNAGFVLTSDDKLVINYKY